jgi:hypothetical protein
MLCAPCLALAQQATLQADTAVTTAHPATNYGTLSNLYINSSSTALLRFDLGTLPSGITADQVSRATLRLYVNRVNTPGVLTVSPVNAAWAESAVTSQTLPTLGNAVEVFPITDEGQFVTVDITSLVKAWVATPATNFGLAITATTADAVLDSKESDTTAHPAQLDIAATIGTAGPAGPQGPVGPKGDTGATGATGATGPQGPQGPKGDTGPQGPAGTGGTTVINGLLFEGAYASTTIYAANQVVTWQNAAYVSLINSNLGNTPSSSASAWAVLVPAASGSGGTGATTIINGLLFEGAYASTTNYATNQVVTWASAAWVSLHDANHGNTPDASPADWGLLVPASQNPATITTVINGLLYQGAYASTTNYATNYVVTWQNTAWVSLHDSNHGNTPDASPADWSVLVPAAVGLTGPQGPKGDTGATGPQGERGYTGDTGPQGPAGATGATGRPGFVYQGVYNSVTNYAAGDVVVWQGGSWASLHDANHGNTPDASPSDWGILTAQGPQGATGPAGPQGPVGPQGPYGEVGPAGPQGLTGAAGATGPQGLPGRDGAQGPTGATGPVGSQGIPGPAGLTWQGAYASTTNYAISDAVAWQGQSFISLHDTNHGNTPSESPADWALLAAQGATGPQGPTGPQGLQGPIGNTGPQGPKGDTGSPGATGPQGIAGMQYQGTYQSSTNYALHDAVTYAGGTWISLASTNHGNTPDTSPTWWQQIAAPGIQGQTGSQGPAGNTGTTGAQGPPGPTGPAGPAGPPVAFRGPWVATTNYVTGDAVFYNGSAYIATATVNGNPPGLSPVWSLLAQQGDTGATGAQGPQGLPGATGATGPAGATGLQGPAGVRWLGAYNPLTGYITGDAVSYNGGSYVTIAEPNSGNTPGATPQWTPLALPGATGATGAPGVNGTNGSNGSSATIAIGTVTTAAAGSPAIVQNVGTTSAATLNFTIPQGAAGATGPAGLHYAGTWLLGTGYSLNDAVYRNGSSYISLHNTNLADPVVAVANSTGDWALLASQGAAGPATVTLGTVTGGTTAAITNSGTQNAAVLNFTLPRGDTGATGPAGLTFLGAWSSTTQYSATNAVSYNGSAYIAIAGNTGVQPTGATGSAAAWALLAQQGATGMQGPAGQAGPAGSTPTIAVAATHTGPAGSNAVVTNVGTATNVQLDFTIPQGVAGASGGTGAGSGVYTTVHSVASSPNGLQVYSPLVDAHSSSDAFNLLGWLPSTCNIATVQVYNSSSTDASFEIHTGTPGHMAVTSAGTCTATAGATTTCTGPGTLGSNNFVSFGITSASSVTTYLYTQFACQ